MISNSVSPASGGGVRLYKFNNSTPNKLAHTDNSIRLRSPKGSPTKRKLTLFAHCIEILPFIHQRVHRILPKPKTSFFSLLLIVFPIAWITFKKVTPNSSSFDVYQNPTWVQQRAFTPPPFNLQLGPNDIHAFDSTLHYLIPKSIYLPKSSNPLQIIYIGRSNVGGTIVDDNDVDVLLDALQRSSYTKVTTIYLYRPSTVNNTHPNHLLYYQQLHSFNPNIPTAIIVDWSALFRDCHILNRILHYMNRQYNYIFQYPVNSLQKKQPQKPYFILLLDSSASSRSVICNDTLHQFFPLEYIRLAKRSIVNNRRWNYTNDWVETGTLIHNTITNSSSINNIVDIGVNVNNKNILFWSGFVSQSYVNLLNIAIHGVAPKRKRMMMKHKVNTHHRPVDVSHYWSSIMSESHHYYYYNRLRQTVQGTINRSRNIMKKYNNNEKDNASRYVEFVGIDTQVEFTNADSTDSNDEGDEEVEDSAIKKSSVHVAILASSMIVVVTQADEWEDHDNRLMEALASGGMVLCDAMIAPPNGLIHKTNVVFFDSAKKLELYLKYYLDPRNDDKRREIARHGVEFALGRHRSWHVLEALLFGKALTRTDKHPLTDKGPDLRKPDLRDPPTVVSL
jgi:hypothetical protein